MQMHSAAERNSQCIGDVWRFGGLGEPPLGLNRPLHLQFARVPVAADGLLDPIGGEMLQCNSLLPCGEENHAAGVSHQYRGTRVGVVGIQLLDGTDVRLVLGKELFQFAVQFEQAIGKGGFGIEADHAAVDESGADRMPVDHAVTGEPQAGIDSKNSHMLSVARASSPCKWRN
jgi:hypothetical protein